MSSSVSIVEYFSENPGSSCGYCKGKSSSFSHGLWGHILTPSDYQDMIDRGWRRSGKYCYKPTMNKTCCPQYPIRCNVKEFVPRKSHKKVMKRFRNYIINDAGANRKLALSELPPLPDSKLKVSSYDSESDESYGSDEDNKTESNKQTQLDNQKADEVEKKLKMNQTENTDSNTSSILPMTTQPSDNVTVQNDNAKCTVDGKPEGSDDVRDGKSTKIDVKPGLGPDPNKPPARKAKDIRKERALLKKQLNCNIDNTSSPPIKNSNGHKVNLLLDQLIDMNTFPKDSKHKLEIRLVNAQTRDSQFMESFEESFQVYRKYQVAIHKDKPEKCTAKQFTRFLCDSSLVRGGGCTTGTNFSSHENNFFPESFGAYHQQYLIDDKIVCVGVLDILPHCASSVYFYYDPEYSFLSLGTLSSLFEISYVRKLTSLWRPELVYYYMGFYIHSCPKMRYKSQYNPSYLLCPETYDWFNVKECSPKLDKSKYSRFNEDNTIIAADSQHPTDSDLNSVHVLHKQEGMLYGMLVEKRKRRMFGGDGSADREEVSEYATLTGIPLARKMLLYRS